MSRKKSASHEEKNEKRHGISNHFETTVRCWCEQKEKSNTQYARSCLHLSCMYGRADILEYLLTSGYLPHQINRRDRESGWSPLHRCLYQGNLDCAPLLLKAGADLKVQDRNGLTPLDFVAMDHPARVKERVYARKDTSFLSRAVQPFEAMDPSELSLNVGDILQSVTNLERGWSEGRRATDGMRGRFPSAFVKDLGQFSGKEAGLDFHEVYLWGDNSNFTLAQKDGRNKSTPELVSNLSHGKINVKQVCLSKFHCLMLTHEGAVYSCGHGRGGRLGHGDEQTVLVPAIISMPDDAVSISAVAVGRDHSLFLDSRGRLYSCGLNNFYQLGYASGTEMFVKPTQILHSSTKVLAFTCIAAARFHSAVSTQDDVFTFGLNGGQLGHRQGDEYQRAPKLVSALHGTGAKVVCIVASDGATACLFSNRKICVLQNYTCRKIVHDGLAKELVMSGGSVSMSEEVKVFHHLEMWKPQELRLCVLSKISGQISTWTPSYASLRKCYYSRRKYSDMKASSIALGKSLMLVTDSGELLKCSFAASRVVGEPELTKPAKSKTSHTAIVRGSARSLDDVYAQYSAMRREEEELCPQSVPNIYRAVSAAVDPSGRTFGVVQSNCHTSFLWYPVACDGTFQDDLSRLQREADPCDDIHDVKLICKDGTLAAHKILLPTAAMESIQACAQSKNILELTSYLCKDVQSWLNAVYRDECLSGPREFITMASKEAKNGRTEARDSYDESDNAYFTVDDQDADTCPERNIRRLKRPKLHNWKQRSDISDTTLTSADGRSFHCHRCVLIARSEYFNGMLMHRWMETESNNNGLSVDVPGNTLKCVLDFLYTDDESYSLPNDCSVEFLCDMIVYSDQLLIKRLSQICEARIIRHVTLKNAIDLYRFAMAYHAELLLQFTAEFIALNLCYFLETRLLDQFEPDEMGCLTTAYKSLVHGMHTRSEKQTLDLELFAWDVEEISLTQKPRSGTVCQSSSSKELTKEKRENPSCQDVVVQESNGGGLLDAVVVMEEICKDTVVAAEDRNQAQSDDIKIVDDEALNASPVFGLRKIINEEKLQDETVSKQRKSPAKWGIGKRKKSQREKKLEQQSLKHEAAVLEHAVDTVEADERKQVTPTWGVQPSQPSSSFSALMDEERKRLESAVPKPVKTEPRVAVRPHRLSTSENPWGDRTAASPKSLPLKGIMANQDEECVNAKRDMKKALHLIQIEERAMEELLHKYQENDKLRHYFVVERLQDSAVSQPVWQNQLTQY